MIGLVLQVVLSLIICGESVPAGLIGKAAGPNMLKDSVLLVQVDPLWLLWLILFSLLSEPFYFIYFIYFFYIFNLFTLFTFFTLCTLFTSRSMGSGPWEPPGPLKWPLDVEKSIKGIRPIRLAFYFFYFFTLFTFFTFSHFFIISTDFGLIFLTFRDFFWK